MTSYASLIGLEKISAGKLNLESTLATPRKVLVLKFVDCWTYCPSRLR